MRSFRRLMLLVAVGALLASCGSEKTAATSAITAAETAWAAAKDNVTKVMPDGAKQVDDAIAAAKASLEGGNAKAALEAAQGLPAKIQELTAGLATKEAELRGVWTALNTALPGVLTEVQTRVDALAKSKKLPAGLDAAGLDGVKSSLTQATQMWTEAQGAEQSGNIAEAVTKATGVKDALVQIMGTLKLPVPAALQPPA